MYLAFRSGQHRCAAAWHSCIAHATGGCNVTAARWVNSLTNSTPPRVFRAMVSIAALASKTPAALFNGSSRERAHEVQRGAVGVGPVHHGLASPHHGEHE